jgi:uncharacterized iron-regulated membrane protein
MKKEESSRDKRKRMASSIRTFRAIHRTLGAFLFVVFVVVSLTGLLLGWKKNTNGLIHPETARGSSTDLREWLPIDSLQVLAFTAIKEKLGNETDLSLDRIDARPDKGMVKFIFKNHYNGVQIDGKTGEVLQFTRRNSDLVEDLHDGSILDKWLGTDGEVLKVIYTSIIGLALLLFSVTGFWLWYGPKVMRNTR